MRGLLALLLAFCAVPAWAQTSPYTTTQDAATVMDTRIDSNAATSNRDGLTTWAVGLTAAPATFRGLLNFAVTIADEVYDVIDSAKVTITVNAEAMVAGDSIDVHVLLKTFTETGATWNKYDGVTDWATAGGGSGTDYTATRLVRYNGNVTGDITFRVDSWVQGLVDGATQHGLLFKRATESGTSNMSYHSDKAADTGNFAQLVVWSHASSGLTRMGASPHRVPGINTTGVGVTQP